MTNPYFLSKGPHSTAEDGRCAMEWVAYLAGEPHSDQPVCVDRPLRTFCIAFNDALDDETRQKLRPYLARCIGTAGDGRMSERGYMCLDWLIRTYTPAWLELGGLADDASRLRALPAIESLESARRAGPVVRKAGAAAWAAAWDAARAAARDAAWDAVKAAGPAWAAVGAAAWDAAWAAVWAAARAAARDAAWAAAWAAARDAARDAFVPTVETLQMSAFELLDRMLPLEPIQIPDRIEVADALCHAPSSMSEPARVSGGLA